ncbi:MAG: hypothetical protein KGY46_01355 [Anaerolineales bacterium]|nr:hypothetical protein [Anaerolineales bacterium]
MIYKTKSWILFLVFSLSLVPFGTGQAEGPDRSFGEARTLLYLSDALLEDEANLDTAAHVPGLMALAPAVRQTEGAEEVLDRMIHATKQERNDHDANCRQLKRRYQSAGDRTAVQKLETYCKAERQRLTNRISFLRRLRGGDRRKVLTRWWHSIKRNSANLWRRIGPVGRNILRNVGDEAFNVVFSGGSLSAEVVRRLAKQAVKSTAREKLKQMAYRGVERLLQGQINIARAAGVLEDEEGDQDAQDRGESTCQTDWWSTSFWENEVLPDLLNSDKRCGDFQPYQVCLEERARAGDCFEDAFATCETAYQDILSTSSGKVVKIVDDQFYHRDHDNHFDLSFSLSGGPVTGSLLIDYQTDYGDGDYCRVTVEKIYQGTFDPATCVLSGTVAVAQRHEETRNDICWGDPFERVENWSMTIKDGVIRGTPGTKVYPLSVYLE